MRILSWNLLKAGGAGVPDIGHLVERHRPDLVLMQEATAPIDALPGREHSKSWGVITPRL